MKVKVQLLFLLASLTGAQTLDSNVKAGEMVVLWCPQYKRDNHAEVKTTWTSYTTQEMDLTNMSSSEQRQMGVLIHDRSLVIFRASSNHHGNYSCSLGSAGSQSWFRLTVYTTLSREYEEMTQYKKICYTTKSCQLYCPASYIPAVNIPNITSNGVTWHKEGETLSEDSYYFSNGERKEKIYHISSVDKKDRGVYTCTRSFLYLGQIYNQSFTLVLDVQTNNPEKYAVIKKPHNNTVFHVDLGSTVVIDCKADYSDFGSMFWFSENSFVEMKNSSSVFYNYTWDKHEMTASLVFKKVSEKDLSKHYMCKLQSDSQPLSFVTITLAATNIHHSHVPLAVSIVGIAGMMVLTVVIYVKLKIDITLFLRDTLGCHSSTSDGKSYDAFLMCYKSDTDTGLNAHDKKWLENVLEEKFGYSLCIYDRDVLPGKAVAEAVLDCTGQSRTVVLIPTSLDLGPGSGLLSAVHEALVERQTRLVFIKTDATEVSKSEPLPEVLQHLGKAGHCVTWKGISSTPLSSPFWKELRYYLPPMQLAPKIWFLPNTIQDVRSW
ncbi:hypothetical protein PAMP_000344 [Pampus punctatissimus]